MAADRQGAFNLLLEMDRLNQERRAHAEEQLKDNGRWQYIRYRVGDSLFVTSIGDVVEILPLAKLTPVPFTKPWIKGVTNIRGDVYVVTDFSHFLFEKPLVRNKKNKLIVLKGESHSALLVDEIIGMVEVRDDEIDQQVSDADEAIRDLVGGNLNRDESRYFLLDARRLLNEDNFIHAAI